MKKITTLVFFGVLFLVSCQNIDQYRKERVAKADRAFTKIRAEEFPETSTLSLPYCIESALKRNLNLRVYDLKEAVNMERRTAAALGMLPDTIISNDITARSNRPGASSQSLLPPYEESLKPSQSSESWENRVRVEFLFSFIDFGLAYFNAVQAKDNALITLEQKRRAAQNLILDVARAYFKVAAAQYAMEKVEKMLKISDETEKLLETMVKNRRLPMEKVITEKKTFLILKKSLMEYRRSYENSCIELRSLMGYYPKHNLLVDTSCMKRQALLKIPDIELLEEIALLERPELYQLDIQKHVTAIAARKTLIEMFPNVGVFVDFTNSTNRFLYNHSWWELGARAVYRLLRVPQKMMEYSALESEVDQIDMQVKALSVGVISQVRIAHANLIEVEQRYKICEKLFDAYSSHEKLKEKQAQAAGMLSRVELNRISMETAQKDIERTQALGNFYIAYFRLLNSIGLNSIDPETLDNLKERVIDSFAQTKYEESESIAEYQKEKTELDKEIAEYNKKIDKMSFASETSGKNVSDIDAKVQKLAATYREKERRELKDSEAKLAYLNSQLVSNQNKIGEFKQNLKLQSKNHESKISKLEGEYNGKVKMHSEGKIEDKDLANFKQDFSKKVNRTEAAYSKTKSSIEKDLQLSESKVSELKGQIDKEKEKIENVVYELKDDYENQVEDLTDNKADHAEVMEDYKKELSEYVSELNELEYERAEVLKKLEESQSIIKEHDTKLIRYVAAMDLLKRDLDESAQTITGTRVEGVISRKPVPRDLEAISDKIDEISELAAPKGPGEIGPSKPVKLSPVSNRVMETQTQTKSPVAFEAFQPEATKNIDMQTQKDAGTAKIPIQAYQPETQNDITIQTQKDAGKTQIDFQEYGSEFNTEPDRIK